MQVRRARTIGQFICYQQLTTEEMTGPQRWGRMRFK